MSVRKALLYNGYHEQLLSSISFISKILQGASCKRKFRAVITRTDINDLVLNDCTIKETDLQVM